MAVTRTCAPQRIRRAAGIRSRSSRSACPSRDKVTAQGPYAREVADAIPKIEKVTGLKFKKQPVIERRTKEQVHDFLVKQFEDERSQADLDAQQMLLRRLGLVSENFDLRALMLDLYTEQIVGFYDPATKMLYVVDGAKPRGGGLRRRARARARAAGSVHESRLAAAHQGRR